MQLKGSLLFQKESRVCIVLQIYLFTLMYPNLSIRSSLFLISCAKLLHKFIKTLHCEFSFQITCILLNLSRLNVILKQLLQVFLSSLKVLAIMKSWQQSLPFLENVLSINHSRCCLLVSMSNPFFIDILQYIKSPLT